MANITADGFTLASPDRNQLRNAYRIIVQDLKEKWAIVSVPLTSRPLDEIFRMSIRRVPPFQEEGKGFQDTVILLSVIDHLCEATGQVGAFISRDTDFKEQEVTKLTGSIGAQIKLYKTISEISEVLMDQMRENIRENIKSEWERDQREVAELLKTMLPQIEEFITKNLEVPKWQLFLEGRIVAVPRIEVTQIKSVQTPLLSEKKDGQLVKISFDTKVNLHAVIERFPPLTPLKVGEELLAEEPPAQELRIGVGALQGPKRETEILQRVVGVEATATIRDNGYKDIQFVSAR